VTLLDLRQIPLTLTQLSSESGDILSVMGYVDRFTVPLLQPSLLAAAERRDHPKAGSLTIDLSCVRYLDRSGLDMLLRVREKAAAQNCALVIRLRPGSQPESLFRSSKILSGCIAA
jgi:anti-anti-sigma regulatory factor